MRKMIDATPLQTELSVFLALEAAIKADLADRHCVFEISADVLPGDWRYGILAGIGRAIYELQTFVFDDQTLSFLYAYLDQRTINYLETFDFNGNLAGLPEGEFFVAHTPVLTLECTYGAAILLEGFLLSILNHDAAVATAAFQLRGRLPGKKLYATSPHQEHEATATAFARSSYIAGFDAITSPAALRELKLDNAYIGFREDLVALTGSHRAALEVQAEQLGVQTTVLLNSRDRQSLDSELAEVIEVFGPELFAVRFTDSKNLVRVSKQIRKALNAAEAFSTSIIYAGPFSNSDLADIATKSEIDSLAISAEQIMFNQPRSVGFQLHLVAVQDETYGEFRIVTTGDHVGGKKTLYREAGADWTTSREILITDPKQQIQPDWDRPGIIYIQRGKLITLPQLEAVRTRVEDAREMLPSGRVETIYLPADADIDDDAQSEFEEE